MNKLKILAESVVDEWGRMNPASRLYFVVSLPIVLVLWFSIWLLFGFMSVVIDWRWRNISEFFNE